MLDSPLCHHTDVERSKQQAILVKASSSTYAAMAQVYSKLQTGQLPTTQELFSGLEKFMAPTN